MAKYIKTEKKVKIGQTLRIHPSMGFLGIEEGVIKVLDFVPWNELPNYIDKEAYADGNEYIEKEVWVKYTYTEKRNVNYGQEAFFPASWFLDHITTY